MLASSAPVTRPKSRLLKGAKRGAHDSAHGSMSDLPSMTRGVKGASKQPALPPSLYDDYFADVKRATTLAANPTTTPVDSKTQLLKDRHTLIAILKRTNHGPHLETLIKRHKNLRKRIDRIERYENNDIDTLNADQRDSLAVLPGLRGAIRELEDLIRILSEQQDSDLNAVAAQAQRHAQELERTRSESARTTRATLLDIFKTYVNVVRELVDLDPDDTTVSQLRVKVFDPKIAFDIAQRVHAKDDSLVEGVDGVTYAHVHTRLIEAPLRLEDLITPPDFMAPSGDVNNAESGMLSFTNIDADNQPINHQTDVNNNEHSRGDPSTFGDVGEYQPLSSSPIQSVDSPINNHNDEMNGLDAEQITPTVTMLPVIPSFMVAPTVEISPEPIAPHNENESCGLTTERNHPVTNESEANNVQNGTTTDEPVKKQYRNYGPRDHRDHRRSNYPHRIGESNFVKDGNVSGPRPNPRPRPSGMCSDNHDSRPSRPPRGPPRVNKPYKHTPRDPANAESDRRRPYRQGDGEHRPYIRRSGNNYNHNNNNNNNNATIKESNFPSSRPLNASVQQASQ